MSENCLHKNNDDVRYVDIGDSLYKDDKVAWYVKTICAVSMVICGLSKLT